MVPDVVGKPENSAISQGCSDLPAVISTTLVRAKITLPPPASPWNQGPTGTLIPIDSPRDTARAPALTPTVRAKVVRIRSRYRVRVR